MSEDRHDYLWDGSGPVDDEVAELEDLLADFRYRGSATAIDSRLPARGVKGNARALWWLMMAAGVALVVTGWVGRDGEQVALPVARLQTPTISPQQVASLAPTQTGWEVSVLRGTPTCDGAAVDDGSKLMVGGWLETRDGDEARIAVGDIGEMKLGPRGRMQLVQSDARIKRVELQRGRLHAIVDAPPRMFLVDTPTATAVDLGCEYTLEVQPDGGVALAVDLGWVALEMTEQRLATYVPAGFRSATDGEGRASLPVRRDSGSALEAAVARYQGRIADLSGLLQACDAADLPTLWQLLARVPAPDRRRVYDRIVALGGQPASDPAALLAGEMAALMSYGQLLGAVPPPGWPERTAPDTAQPPVWAPAAE